MTGRWDPVCLEPCPSHTNCATIDSRPCVLLPQASNFRVKWAPLLETPPCPHCQSHVGTYGLPSLQLSPFRAPGASSQVQSGAQAWGPARQCVWVQLGCARGRGRRAGGEWKGRMQTGQSCLQPATCQRAHASCERMGWDGLVRGPPRPRHSVRDGLPHYWHPCLSTKPLMWRDELFMFRRQTWHCVPCTGQALCGVTC